MNAKSNTKTFLYRTAAILMIAMLLLAAMPVISASATSIGFFSPTTAKSNGPGWKNSTYTFVSDDLYATATRGHKQLKLSNFNITAIQGGATIDGIEVTVEGHTLGLQADVTLFNATSGQYTKNPFGVKTTSLSGSDTVYTLGGPTELWGKTWNSSDFTNTNFIINLNTTGTRGETISVDQVRVKVYYTLGDSTLTLNPVSGSYGGTASMTATLTATVGGAPIAGQLISFSLNGTSVGSATTNLSGVATLPSVSLAGINAGDYPSGAFASFAGGGTFSATSITADLYVHGTPTTLTTAPVTFTYTGATGTTTFSATLLETVSGNPVSGETVSFYLGDTLAGSGSTDGSGNVSITGSYLIYDVGVYIDEVTAEFAGDLIIEPSTDSAVLTVNPITLTVSGGLTPSDKVYDSNTTASLTIGSPTLVGVVSPDVVTLNTTGAIGTFSDENIGVNKTVQISGLTLEGADAGNYSVTQPTRQASITVKPITVTAVTNTKVYDGTTSAAATPTNSGLAPGDTANFTESYDTKHVGIGNKTLAPAGVVNDGNSGNNYSYTYTNFTEGTITTLPITVTAVMNTKMYDGTTSAAAIPINSGLATGDTASFTEAYSDENVGIGNKTLVPSGIVSDGNSGNNYSYTYTNFTTGTINAADQTIVFGALANKTFGDADFGVSATASSGLAVSFSSTTTSVCTVSGSTVHIVAGGTCTVRASQAGNSNYNAAPNVDQSFTVNPASQTITFGALANKTFGNADFTVSATASSGLAVSFSSTTTSVCTVSGSTVHLVAGGTCTIRASQAGNSNYNAAPNVDRSFTVNKASQTITFGALANKTFGNADFAVSATASSGLAVSFSSTTASVCTVSGSTVHIVAVGTCIIRASQAGNSNYNAAPNVDRSFTVNKASQTITFGALANKTLGDADFAVSATASSGLAVSFSSNTTSVCTVSGSTVHLVAVGTCTIRASQAGNGNYNAAPNVDQSFTVAAAPNIAPVITEGASIGINMSQNGSTILTLNATDANGDILTWSISTAAGHGTASASGTGTSKDITYTPALDYIGSDSFVVQVSDGNGGTDTIIVNVTITAVEPTPFILFLPLVLR